MNRMRVLEEDFHRSMAVEATANGASWVSAWIRSGHDLEDSADALWQPLAAYFEQFKRGDPPNAGPVIGPFLLLAGFAIENYLKALCVKAHGATDASGNFKFGHHDFLKLAGDTAVAFDTSELELIERLEHYVVFAGRYPAPKNHRSLLPRVYAEGGFGPLSFLRDSDHSKWKDLCGKLKAHAQA